MTEAAKLRDVVSAIEGLYPPRWADPGDDAIGLIVGEPDADVRRMLFAVDPVRAVVDEAIASHADLIVAHHPLLFRPVSSVAANTPKGRVIHDLISHGIALYAAHTNADSPARGVCEAMASALGLVDIKPLRADPVDPLDKIVTFVPTEHAQKMIDTLAGAGAGAIGDYDRCAFVTAGEGTFRPGPAASPTIGVPGEVEVVDECRVEMVLARDDRAAVIAALCSAHPYEEPAFDVFELAAWSADRGTGRIGELSPPRSLREFVDTVLRALPSTAVGARVSGDLERRVRRVALVGGAGDFMLDAAGHAGVDAYVTSDLRHHPAAEFREYDDAPALVDVPHWAAEWTWLPVASRALRDELAERGFVIDSQVSRICTDPWNHQASHGAR
ncbi:MAG: Nif3-like dinuclear metal center hexameric protein [Nocardioidaceae bacterium]